MNRLHLPPDQLRGPRAIVRGDALGYLRDVLRLRPGAPIEVFDGAGHAWSAVLDRYDDDEAHLELGTVQERPFAGVRVTLLQGLPKGDKFELIIQKAVELGVSRIVPVEMHRSIVKLDARKAAERVVRWQKIADEAARQCGRAELAVISPVASLSSVIAEGTALAEKRIVLDEEERGTRLRSLLSDAGVGYAFLVGPEGGLSRDEVVEAKLAGFVPATLGPRVLRTETVALATLAVVQHVLGDLG